MDSQLMPFFLSLPSMSTTTPLKNADGATATISTHDQSDEFLKIVECRHGKLVDWVADKKQILATKHIDKCVVLALVNKEHGFLFHFEIFEGDEFEDMYQGFHKWLSARFSLFPIPTQLFLFCFPSKMEPSQRLLANEIVDELDRIMPKEQAKTIYGDFGNPEDMSSVELYSDGSGTYPTVRCNGKKIPPGVPSFDGGKSGIKRAIKELFAPYGI